ncbi:hypothetical protein J4433_03480 [Candidatus Pacearchaeota archaeon]|nr:hypothetical protein [Candidatus Pacearchaeota archaeon]
MNKFRKTLSTLLIPTIISLTGCFPVSSSDLEGIIKGDKVRLVRKNLCASPVHTTYLYATKSKKKEICYVDYDNDLKLDNVRVCIPFEEMKFYDINDPLDRPIMEEAQKQFEEYMKIITPYLQSKEKANLR